MQGLVSSMPSFAGGGRRVNEQDLTPPRRPAVNKLSSENIFVLNHAILKHVMCRGEHSSADCQRTTSIERVSSWPARRGQSETVKHFCFWQDVFFSTCAFCSLMHKCTCVNLNEETWLSVPLLKLLFHLGAQY